MRETRTERCGQDLVNAQVNIDRAVFELNAREFTGEGHGRGRKPKDEYTFRCVIEAMESLSNAAKVLLGRKKEYKWCIREPQAQNEPGRRRK